MVTIELTREELQAIQWGLAREIGWRHEQKLSTVFLERLQDKLDRSDLSIQ